MTEKPYEIRVPLKVYADSPEEAVEHLVHVLSDANLAHLVHGDLDDVLTVEEVDESSSASRQHAIETGRYLLVRETRETDVARDDDPIHPQNNGG